MKATLQAAPSGLAQWAERAAGILLLVLLLRPVFELPALLLAEPGAYAPDPGVHEWRISAALVLAGLVTAAAALGRGARVPRLACLARVVWIGLACASIRWSVDRGATVRHAFELAALGGVWWAAVQLGGHVAWRRAGAAALLLGLLAMCAAGLYQYFVLLARIRIEVFGRMTEWIGPVAADRLYSNRVYATFISPSVFGDYLAVLLPLALGCALARWGARRRGRELAMTVCAVAAAGLGFWCLLLTTARGAWRR